MIILLLFSQIDSLSLDQAINLALTKSPSYQESKITLDQSRILFYQSLANLLPTITTNASYTKSEYKGIASKTYSGSINLNMPVFDLDVLSSIIVSGHQLKGNGIQYHADVSNLILNLKTAYYKLINAQELIKSSELAIARAEENLKLAKAKYELGSASKLEMLQGEVFYLRAMQDRASAKTLKISAQEELKSILGISNEPFPIDTLALPGSPEFPPIDSLMSILQKVNYNIRVAQELRNVAKLEVVTSYLAFLPKISFFYGYSSSSDSLIFDFQYHRENARKNYGINISFPIFELKTLIFNNLKARKDLQLKEFTKQRIILETEKSLRTTYYALSESYDKLLFAQKSFDAASEAATIAKEQYTLGAISFLDFLATESDLYTAKVSYSSAISDFYIQRANFSYLVGNLTLNRE